MFEQHCSFKNNLFSRTMGDFTFWLSMWLRPKAELKLNLRAQLWSEPGLRIKYWLSPEFITIAPGSRFCKEG